MFMLPVSFIAFKLLAIPLVVDNKLDKSVFPKLAKLFTTSGIEFFILPISLAIFSVIEINSNVITQKNKYKINNI